MPTESTSRSWARWGLAAAVLALTACQTPGVPPVAEAPGATDYPVSAVPSETPTPQATPLPRRVRLDFEAVPLGGTPEDFVDVKSEAETASWVYQGNWRVTQDERGNRVFTHDDVRQQPAVSFQRYRGTGLGKPDGQLPEVYYAEVAMRPIKSPYNYPPTGDQGVQFYYLSYNTYLEVIIKPDMIEIWESDAAAPNTSKGWRRLWFEPLETRAGDTRRIGALVDTRAGTFTAYLDGEPLETVESDLLAPQPAWLALRGIGNVVSFDDVLIEAR